MTRLEWGEFVQSGELLKTNLSARSEFEKNLKKSRSRSTFRPKKSIFFELWPRYPSWNDVNEIDLNEFYQKTRPVYILKACYFNNYDCRADWKIVHLLSGNCLQLNTMPIFVREKFGPRAT